MHMTHLSWRTRRYASALAMGGCFFIAAGRGCLLRLGRRDVLARVGLVLGLGFGLGHRQVVVTGLLEFTDKLDASSDHGVEVRWYLAALASNLAQGALDPATRPQAAAPTVCSL
eukprot:1452949-Pyramimonas_sp.AAC.1